ncbi:Type III secretion protein YscO [Pseudomonas gessardii]|uniref:YscO family type III secretion system apparatus protein n=1 Tax=Pseudomonas gessardii TaxID=78544 RepID=A0ABS9FBY5_9PSED|nr:MULTISPECIES: YscO family type III secretion system apparatus protein [Pseudomonas]MCF4981665.1 YscO family type III secretion system apparatus protein [Pseudomonas gessardii]MCF4990269.1 YscO family type III secretion system apparatus protein [Pseudomonas gessardii]MCF5087295.1 YscO family type III secretion system apparatus protein [Pseudomonas gessardii]MCF5095086.1 YscO family type III secretion system apparatus protein [Pseudomonas gessardii]MCF5109855.1 YscO family type III secretion 
MSLSELDTLRRLRRHRADRAERALREAKRHQQALLAQIQQAQQALEQTRLEEIEKTAELLEKHQGQVLSLSQLKAWGTQERTLSAGTRREEGQLHELHGRREEQVVQVASAQKQVSQCLKEVEKLQELSVLLAQEDIQEEI